MCDFRAAIGNPLFKRLDEINHFPGMAGDLHAAPLAQQHASAVDDEGAAFDAPDLFAIHILHFDDAEQIAGGFFLVAEQLERQILFRLEIFVGLQAIARDTVNLAAMGLKFRIKIAELLCFGSAAGSGVFGIEVQDYGFSFGRG